MPGWIYRVYAIVSVADLSAAQALSAALGSDKEEAKAFANPLLNNQGVVIAWGLSTAMTELCRQAAIAYLATHPIASLRWWRCNYATGILIDTNVAASQAQVGSVWSWQQARTNIIGAASVV